MVLGKFYLHGNDRWMKDLCEKLNEKYLIRIFTVIMTVHF